MWLFLLALLLGAIKTLTHLDVLHVQWAADMPWWVVVAVFAATAAWWAWADYSGLTRRQAEGRMQARKDARIERQKAAMGRPTRKR